MTGAALNAPARLELQEVCVSYANQNARQPALALDNINLQIAHGAQAAVVGPNGAGKSTLFKALVGLLPLRSGRVLIHGQPFGSHTDCVAYVPQREDVDWRFPVTVADVVMMGRFNRQGWLRRPARADHLAVQRSLEQMGLADLAGRSISDLSGGQQQRVFLARALAQEPHILLMDEPFTGIDAATQEVTLSLLETLKRQQVTVLVSTHDLNMAQSRFEHVLLLNRRLIAYGPAAQVFTPENIQRTFSGQILVLNLPTGAPIGPAEAPGEVRLGIVVDECCPPDDPEHIAHGHSHARPAGQPGAH